MKLKKVRKLSLQLKDALAGIAKKYLIQTFNDKKIVILIVASVFGLTKRFQQKYRDANLAIFELHLPGLSVIPNHLDWATFDQCLNDSIQSEYLKTLTVGQSNLSIKKIDFFTDRMFIETSLNWQEKQRQIYLGSFQSIKFNTLNTVFPEQYIEKKFANPSHFSEIVHTCTSLKNELQHKLPQIGNNWYMVFSKQNKKPKNLFSLTTNTYLIFDDLPRRIACITKEKFTENLNFEQLEIFSINEMLNTQKYKLKNPIHQNYFRWFSLNVDSNVNQKFFFVMPKVTKKENSFFNGKKNSLINENSNSFFEFKVKKNFYSQNIIPVSSFKELNHNKKFNDTELLDIEINDDKLTDTELINAEVNSFGDQKSLTPKQKKLIQLIQAINEIIPFEKNNLISLRLMSGYIAPDSNTNLTNAMLRRNFYIKNNRLIHTFFPNFFNLTLNPVFEIIIPKNSYFFHSSLFSANKLKSKLIANSKYANFYSSLDYYHIKTPEELKLEGLPTNSEAGEYMYYGGPVFFYRNTRKTDAVRFKNRLVTHKKINKILGSGNILTDQRSIFFGKNVYSSFEKFSDNQKFTRLNKQIDSNNISNNLDNKSDKSDSNDVSNDLNDKTYIDDLSSDSLESPKTINPDNAKRSFFKSRRLSRARKKRRKLSFEINLKKLHYLSLPSKNSVFQKVRTSSELFKPDPSIYYQKFDDITSGPYFKNKKTPLQTYPIKEPYNPCVILPLDQIPMFNSIKPTVKSYFQIEHRLKNLVENNLAINHSNTKLLNHFFSNSENLSNKKLLNLKYKIISKPSFYKKSKKKSFKKQFKDKIKLYESPSVDSWLFLTQVAINSYLLSLLKIMILVIDDGLKEIAKIMDSENNQQERQEEEEREEEPEISIEKSLQRVNRPKKFAFRLSLNSSKRITDLIGVDSILPNIARIIGFLQVSTEVYVEGSHIPKQILLLGPPGTGKTLVVQAMAGESGVPILAESGSALSTLKFSAIPRIINLFAQARKMAPCIVFIDEIDNIAKKRPDFDLDILDLFRFLYPKKTNQQERLEYNHFFYEANKFTRKFNIRADKKFLEWCDLNFAPRNVDKYETKDPNKYQIRQIRLLLEVLIQIDGVTKTPNIITIAATNRQDKLDHALIRPGRFDTLFKFRLPGHDVRIKLFKFYSKNLGFDNTVPWSYLSDRTENFSPSEISNIINFSTIKAVQQETFHTLKTLEGAVNSVTGYNAQRNRIMGVLRTQSPGKRFIYLTRLAYYQAGKLVIRLLLPYHPKGTFVQLWPENLRIRLRTVYGEFKKQFSIPYSRFELEAILIGFYGGKAAEQLLSFYSFKNRRFTAKQQKKIKGTRFINETQDALSLFESNFGYDDMQKAGWLAQLMIKKWYMYSSTFILNKDSDNLPMNLNNSYRAQRNKQINFLEHATNLFEESEPELLENYLREREESKQKKVHDKSGAINPDKDRNFEVFRNRSWFTYHVWKNSSLFVKKKKALWNNVYFPDQYDINDIRYVFPDIYYHSNNRLKNLLNTAESPQKENKKQKANLVQAKAYLHKVTNKKTSPKNIKNIFEPNMTLGLNQKDKLNFYRGFKYHTLLLECFNASVAVLDENRELLDLFASSILQKEILRKEEISQMFTNFIKKKN